MFNRTEQQAREHQVLARISAREALLTAAEREIEPELWRATHGAAGTAETVRASRYLLDNADTPYNIAMARFTSSVGSALKILSAQKAFASANSSATQAEITALATRIRLSPASGRMQPAKCVQGGGTKKMGSCKGAHVRTTMLVVRRLGRGGRRRRARCTARTATTTFAGRRSAAALCLFWLLGAASATASNQIHFLKCQYSHVILRCVISRGVCQSLLTRTSAVTPNVD